MWERNATQIEKKRKMDVREKKLHHSIKMKEIGEREKGSSIS